MAALATSPLQVTTDQLFDWAERTYPDLFPSHQTTQSLSPYLYRYYPQTDLYVGVADGVVYLLGTTQTQGRIVSVGNVSDFAPIVQKDLDETAVLSYSARPKIEISYSDSNSCFTSQVTAIDMDNDGSNDLVAHFWCNQFNVPEGFNGPTPDSLRVFLNKGDHFEDGTFKIFGTNNVSLGGASRKSVVADFNNDGRLDIAYAINREDGRPIGNALEVAATKATVVTSTAANRYSVDRLGDEVWYHAVDSYEFSPNKRAVVYHGMGWPTPNAKAYSRVNDSWVLEAALFPPLNGLTYRFLKSSVLLGHHDIVVTVGQNDATELDVYKKTNDGWNKDGGYSPPVKKGVVPVAAWNGDRFMGNRIDIDGASYTGAGFDDSCIIKRNPNSVQMFVGKFSGRKLPDGYGGGIVEETEMRLGYQLFAFEVSNGSLRKVDLGLDTPLGNDFFNFIDCIDVNADGYDDIVVSVQRSGGLPDIYLNNKSNGFAKVPGTVFPNVQNNNGDERALLSDLDRDGVSDLIIFNLFTSPKSIKVYKGLENL